MLRAAPRCPVCSSESISTVEVRHTFFRHMDFMPTASQPGQVLRCMHCQMAFMGDAAAVAESHAMHVDASYAANKKTQYVVYNKDNTAAVTTYALIADMVAPYLDGADPHVLDIGCFDGKLLLELERRFPAGQFHGFDVSEHVRQLFPRRPNFTFWSRDREKIAGRFDAILIVNALMYVNDPVPLMRDVERLLKPRGVLFIVVPDIACNPFALLYADQYTFYTPAIARNFCTLSGFASAVVDAPAFPRSLIIVARRALPRKSAGDLEQDGAIEAAARYLDVAKAELLAAVARHRETGGGQVAVLGCNPNAAWARSVLGAGIDVFTDENESRVGGSFYGRPVVYPRDLAATDLLVLPYGATGATIAAKFSARYAVRLVTV